MGGGGGGGLGRAGRMLLCRPRVLVPAGIPYPCPVAVSEEPFPACKLSWEEKLPDVVLVVPVLAPVLMYMAPVEADR